MFYEGIIQVLLIEDEEFDVRRVKNTIEPFSDRIKILNQTTEDPKFFSDTQKIEKIFGHIIKKLFIAIPIISLI